MINTPLCSQLYFSDRYLQGNQNYHLGNQIINQAIYEETNAMAQVDYERFRALSALDRLANAKQSVFYNTLAPFLNSHSATSNFSFISLDYSENIPNCFLYSFNHSHFSRSVYYQEPSVILSHLADHGYRLAVALSHNDIEFVRKNGLCGTLRPIRNLYGVALSNAIYAFFGNGTIKKGGLGIKGGQRILQERFTGYFFEFTLDAFYQTSLKHISDARIFAENTYRNNCWIYSQGNYFREVANIADEFTNRILILEDRIRRTFSDGYSLDSLNNLSFKMQNAMKLLRIVNMPILDLNGNIIADLSLLADSNDSELWTLPHSLINYNNYTSTIPLF